MKLHIYIGSLFIFLNSSLCFGASTYLFEDGSCFELNGANWLNLGDCNSSISHSLKDLQGLFCQYTLKPEDSLKSALTKNKFYRDKEKVSLINYSTGKSSKAVSSTKHLLLSKRDLLPQNKLICKTPDSRSLKESAFALHIPNSFYVIKSNLKKVHAKKIATPTAPKILTVTKEKTFNNTPSSKRKILSFSPRFFYENFKGTQVSNSTTAEISSKLSPGLQARLSFGNNNSLKYSVFTGVDFHIFNEKAGSLSIANSNVQTIHMGADASLNYNFFLNPSFSAELFEDLYYARVSATNIGIEREVVPRFSFSNEVYLYKKNTLSVSIKPTLVFDLAKNRLSEGFGYSAPLAFRSSQSSYQWGVELNYFTINKSLVDLELEHSVLSFLAHMGFKF